MKISVIIPVYNVEDYLSKCLDSIVNQNFNDYEIIIIDDGSIDNSHQIILEYKRKFPDKIVSIKKKNEGQAVARNIGIEMARGEYILFVDSDDYIACDTLRTVYDYAEKDKVDIVCFDSYKILNDNIIDYVRGYNNIDDNLKRYIVSQDCPWGMLIRTELIKKNKLFFPKLRAYEDVSIVPAYALYTKKITFIDKKLYYYFIRKGSTMNQLVYSEKLESIFDSMNHLYNIFKKSNRIDIYHDEIEFLFIKHLLHGAGLRFIEFDNYETNFNKINDMMKKFFPHWFKNKYFKKESLKYKIMCQLLYKKKINLIKKLKR